jgi:hypothetical protein
MIEPRVTLALSQAPWGPGISTGAAFFVHTIPSAEVAYPIPAIPEFVLPPSYHILKALPTNKTLGLTEYDASQAFGVGTRIGLPEYLIHCILLDELNATDGVDNINIEAMITNEVTFQFNADTNLKLNHGSWI